MKRSSWLTFRLYGRTIGVVMMQQWISQRLRLDKETRGGLEACLLFLKQMFAELCSGNHFLNLKQVFCFEDIGVRNNRKIIELSSGSERFWDLGECI